MAADSESAEDTPACLPAPDGPLMYRAMARDQNQLPVLGQRDLGVRVPTDVKPDVNGIVSSARKGMSVAPEDPMNLPLHHRPASLLGTGEKPVWSHPAPELPSMLQYVETSDTHGVVSPAAAMTLAAYESALASTRPDWKLTHE